MTSIVTSKNVVQQSPICRILAHQHACWLRTMNAFHSPLVGARRLVGLCYVVELQCYGDRTALGRAWRGLTICGPSETVAHCNCLQHLRLRLDPYLVPLPLFLQSSVRLRRYYFTLVDPRPRQVVSAPLTTSLLDRSKGCTVYQQEPYLDLPTTTDQRHSFACGLRSLIGMLIEGTGNRCHASLTPPN